MTTSAWGLGLDFFGALLFVVVVFFVAIIARRRSIANRGAGFEMSVNRGSEASARGWMLGVALYGADELYWYRTFSLSLKPHVALPRGRVHVSVPRHPVAAEAAVLHDGHVVVEVDGGLPLRQLAMSPVALTGLLAWLESSPPGAGGTPRPTV